MFWQLCLQKCLDLRGICQSASIFVEVSKRSEEPILEPHRVNRILVRHAPCGISQQLPPQVLHADLHDDRLCQNATFLVRDAFLRAEIDERLDAVHSTQKSSGTTNLVLLLINERLLIDHRELMLGIDVAPIIQVEEPRPLEGTSTGLFHGFCQNGARHRHHSEWFVEGQLFVQVPQGEVARLVALLPTHPPTIHGHNLYLVLM
mmetsp:Transcript_59659/g.139668  ORF Transcript_59659/g.139668 Transcript_59659/m.139668 type:complete len:204 (+) Transcript_59659:244-855(+)